MTENMTATPPVSDVDTLMVRLAESREMAASWIRAQLSPAGEPPETKVFNAWWRIPWALVRAGDWDTASRVMDWAVRHALREDGDFIVPVHGYGAGEGASPAYELCGIAIGAWHLGRYDVADRAMDRMATYQNPATGGILEAKTTPGTPDVLYMTAAAGIAAVATRRTDISSGVYDWFVRHYEMQPELPTKLYNASFGGEVYRDFETPDRAYHLLTDFTQPRQSYFTSSLGAIFLGNYASATGSEAALILARKYFALNTGGTQRQFDDRDSVQICKHGWAAAVLAMADRSNDYVAELARMGEWYVDRQEPTGEWGPSRFLFPDPPTTQRLAKTAEHLMEMSMVETALAAVRP